MGFDRNTIIGFSLLAALLMGYFFYVSKNQKAALADQKRIEDSLAALKPKVDTANWRVDSLNLAHNRDSIAAGNFANSAQGTEATTSLENEFIKATFTNKGGWLQQVELKKYKGPEGKENVIMGGTEVESFGYNINTQAGQSTETSKLFFTAMPAATDTGGNTRIVYQLSSPNGAGIRHIFTVKPNDYRVFATIELVQPSLLVSGNALNLHWQTRVKQQQIDLAYEQTQSRMVYYADGKYDYSSATSDVSEKISEKTDWIGLKQQFFSSVINAPKGINQLSVDAVKPTDTAQHAVCTLKVNGQLAVADGSQATIPLEIFYGPNEYKLLKGYDNGMHNIVDLGSGMFAFVKWINRWFILPAFDFLSKLVGGPGGWSILLLTILIRLLIAPLTYSSYLSGAKMKALKPEIDNLKAKYGTDQQAMSMEQMKLFREAGVNPLGGCIPALFQIPIFFALYSFFNSNISLRGVPFLWATDLSRYDSILNLPFEIPFLGSHISLFTITACLTSLLISVYAMSTTPDAGNPMMKYMPYIFPVMMLFIFNKLPSALTWYYTVSNIITLVLQFVIQNYIIDQKKILTQINANKSKPKSKSKWQARLEQIQESQKKMEEIRKKGGK